MRLMRAIRALAADVPKWIEEKARHRAELRQAGLCIRCEAQPSITPRGECARCCQRGYSW